MKKRLLSLVLMMALLSSMLFIFTGCGDKSAITADAFKQKCEAQGMTVVDSTSDYAQYSHVKKVYNADTKDGSSYQFLEVTDKEKAAAMFENNKATFSGQKGSGATEALVNGGNFAYYKLNTDGKYIYICYVENTMLLQVGPDQFKDSVNDFVNSFGY